MVRYVVTMRIAMRKVMVIMVVMVWGPTFTGIVIIKKTQLTDSSSLSLLRVAGVAGHLQADEVSQSQTKDRKHNAFLL